MNKLEELKQLGVNVGCWGNTIWKGKWHITLEGKIDGVELKITATEHDLQVAVDIAYDKFMAYAPKAMKTPVLEASPPPQRLTASDDIPF